MFWRRQVRGFFSDVLYQSWHFAHTPLAAEWLEHDSIPRRDASQLTLQQFQEDFEAPNRPVIITGEVHRQTHHLKAFAHDSYSTAHTYCSLHHPRETLALGKLRCDSSDNNAGHEMAGT